MGRSDELEGLRTLPELTEHSVNSYAEREALRQFDRSANVWRSLTYEEFGERILCWRRALAALDLRKGERVAVLMPNGIDHAVADQALLANGLVPVPLHAIDTPGSSAYIVRDSGASLLITNTHNRWEQLLTAGEVFPNLRAVVLTDERGEREETSEQGVRILPSKVWLASGEFHQTELPEGPEPDDLAGIIYTSGTTGRPKGVMLTHANIVSNVRDTLECVSPRPGDVFLSFLPLSHTFERTAGYYLALATGCTIAYNRSVLLLAEDLKTVRPDVIISVPRVYERIHARLQDRLRKSTPTERRLFELAVETGCRDFCRKNGLPLDPGSAWRDGLIRLFLLPRVRRTLLEQFGGRLRIAISGGAALGAPIARTFCGLGLPIIQGYGMTETSPIIAGNSLTENQPQTVGRPFANVRVRLGDDNEIQVSGPSVMKGYWGREEATRETFTEDGWLRTGDVGEFTDRGLLRIRGRIKEIIVTSTGEKIPPADLESAIETDPLFAQTYVVGENRPYLSLIAVLNPNEWRTLAGKLGLDPENPDSLKAPNAKTTILKRAKAAAAGFPNYALPRSVLPTLEPWTIENGLLTPTLKLKRGPLSKRFEREIAALYATHG